MDPDENVKEQLSLARDILARLSGDKPFGNLTDDAARLAELVIAQHEWRIAGGFDPYRRNSAG